MKDLKDIYDWRSRIVHEGYRSSKEEAEKALNVAIKFIKLAVTSLDRFKCFRERLQARLNICRTRTEDKTSE